MLEKLAALALLTACGTSDADAGAFTASVCPPTDPPTYASFGMVFMETYCTTCHDSQKTGAMREGAPPAVDFDTLPLLRMWTSQIDREAAFGPAAMNRGMPPAGHRAPSDAERRRLGELVACEVAR